MNLMTTRKYFNLKVAYINAKRKAENTGKNGAVTRLYNKIIAFCSQQGIAIEDLNHTLKVMETWGQLYPMDRPRKRR